MDIQLTGKPKRDAALVINDEYEVPSLLHPMTGKIFVTNRVGVRVIALADGTATVDQITDRVLEQFRGTEREVVSREVAAFLDEGSRKGLITWND